MGDVAQESCLGCAFSKCFNFSSSMCELGPFQGPGRDVEAGMAPGVGNVGVICVCACANPRQMDNGMFKNGFLLLPDLSGNQTGW